MVRMYIHKNALVINETDVVVLEEKAIKYYEKLFPKVKDVEYQLKLLAQLFRFSKQSRAEDKFELDQKIKNYLKNPNITEEKLEKTFKDYIDIKTLDELYIALNK